MTNDGRILVLLGLAGIVSASTLRGSRGVVRSRMSHPEARWYIEVVFRSGDEAQENNDDLEELIGEIDGVSEIDVDFVDYNEGAGDTVHISFTAPDDAIRGIEYAIENWIGSRDGAFWSGNVEAED